MVKINSGRVARLLLVAGLSAAWAVPSEGATKWGVDGRLNEFGELRRRLVSEPVAPIVPQESPYEELKGQLSLYCKDDTGYVAVEVSQDLDLTGAEAVGNGGWKSKAVVRVDGRDVGRWHIAHVKEVRMFGFVERDLDKDERIGRVAGEIDAIASGKTVVRAMEDLANSMKPNVLIQKMVSGSEFAVSVELEEVGRIAFSWSTEGKGFRKLVREVCPASGRW